MAQESLSLPQLLRKFPDDAAAEAWFVEQRWPDGIACPYCGDTDIQTGTAHPKMPYRCRGCHKFFSVKTDTVMHGSNLGYQTWAIAVYLFNTHAKGISSIKLHRDLGITQKTAWHLAHRLREAWNEKQPAFTGEVEIDETFIGGKEKNKHGLKKHRKGTGFVGKTIVAGARERSTGKVIAGIVANTDTKSLVGFVVEHTDEQAVVYTDEHAAYTKAPRHHFTIRQGIKEYVSGRVHTNGIESFWAVLKRGHMGVYHKMGKMHLSRYVAEFVGRHNWRRPLNTMEQMGAIVRGMDGKRLTYQMLTASAASVLTQDAASP